MMRIIRILVQIAFYCVLGISFTHSWAVPPRQTCEAQQPELIPMADQSAFIIAAFGGADVHAVFAAPIPDVTLTTTSNANVRAEASTDAAILTALDSGQTVDVIARNSIGDWLQIRLPDGRGGWVAARIVNVSGDVMALPIAEDDAVQSAEINLTVSGSASCALAGVVIHSLSNDSLQTVQINGMWIDMIGTLALFAENDHLTANVASGSAWLTVNGQPQLVLEGSQTVIQADNTLSPVIPYDADVVQSVTQMLCAEIPAFSFARGCLLVVVPPINPDQIDTLAAPFYLPSGEWLQTVVRDQPFLRGDASTCPEPYTLTIGTTIPVAIETSQMQEYLVFGTVRFYRTAPDAYRQLGGLVGARMINTLDITAPLELTKKERREYENGCITEREFRLNYLRPFPTLPEGALLPVAGVWEGAVVEDDLTPDDCQPSALGRTNEYEVYPMFGGVMIGGLSGHLVSPGLYAGAGVLNEGTPREQSSSGTLEFLTETEFRLSYVIISPGCERYSVVEGSLRTPYPVPVDGTWRVTIDDSSDENCEANVPMFTAQPSLDLTTSAHRIQFELPGRGTVLFIRSSVRNQFYPGEGPGEVFQIVTLDVESETRMRLKERIVIPNGGGECAVLAIMTLDD